VCAGTRRTCAGIRSGEKLLRELRIEPVDLLEFLREARVPVDVDLVAMLVGRPT
jgi:hypothetical protein